MIDKYFEWNIDGIQANTVLEGAEVTIPIDKKNYSDIFINKELLDFIKSNEKVIKDIFTTEENFLDNYLLEEFHLDYHIKDNKYTIGYNYNKILSNVLKKIGIRTVIDFNPSSSIDITKIILQIKREIAFQCEVNDHDGIHNKNYDKLLANLYDNIGLIIKTMLLIEDEIRFHISFQTEEERQLRENHKALVNTQNKNFSWKNLMYYTAIKSVDIFDKTGDKKYYRYAKNYYLNLSRDKQAEYPSGLKVDGIYYDFQYIEFNRRFMGAQRKYFSDLHIKLGIEDKDVYVDKGTLKAGKKEPSLERNKGTTKRKIDYEKLDAGIKRRIKFYNGLKGKIKGIIEKPMQSDLDYIGFVFENNYVVFDKFYEVSKDGTKVTPAHDNAIYITSLDVAVECNNDRRKIRDYIKKNHNYKAMRRYHKDNDSYQDRVMEVLDYQDVSTIKYKELKLINEENN